MTPFAICEAGGSAPLLVFFSMLGVHAGERTEEAADFWWKEALAEHSIALPLFVFSTCCAVAGALLFCCLQRSINFCCSSFRAQLCCRSRQEKNSAVGLAAQNTKTKNKRSKLIQNSLLPSLPAAAFVQASDPECKVHFVDSCEGLNHVRRELLQQRAICKCCVKRLCRAIGDNAAAALALE